MVKKPKKKEESLTKEEEEELNRYLSSIPSTQTPINKKFDVEIESISPITRMRYKIFIKDAFFNETMEIINRMDDIIIRRG